MAKDMENSGILIGSSLMADLRKLIRSAQSRAAVSLNAEVVMLYWSIGSRIRVDLMKNHRAGYGERVQKTVSEKLTAEFGSGWGLRKIQHCVRSADVFSKEQIVSAVRLQLGWRRSGTVPVTCMLWGC